jgi:hypothetical protein
MFIDKMLEVMEEESYSYDESLKQNFIKLQQAYAYADSPYCY